MFDDFFRQLKDQIITPLARRLSKVSPTTITLITLVVGALGIVLLIQKIYWLALICWIANRILDGLDGTMARVNKQQSDLGGYIDILADFVIYAGVPIALVVGRPSEFGYLSLAFLLATFYVNAASWMYLAAILEKRNHGASTTGELTTVTMPAGLIAGTETIVFYSIFIIWPQYLAALFVIMGVLVVITIGQRLLWAIRHLR